MFLLTVYGLSHVGQQSKVSYIKPRGTSLSKWVVQFASSGGSPTKFNINQRSNYIAVQIIFNEDMTIKIKYIQT